MKEELNGKLVEILTSIQSAAGKASDFAMAELPDIAQNYIAYGRAIHSAGLMLSCVVLLVAVFVGLRYAVFNKEWIDRDGWRNGQWAEARIVVAIGSSIVSVVSFVMVTLSAPPAALVWLAPKVWLLKEIAGMLK